jgi:hypothetical protein
LLAFFLSGAVRYNFSHFFQSSERKLIASSIQKFILNDFSQFSTIFVNQYHSVFEITIFLNEI